MDERNVVDMEPVAVIRSGFKLEWSSPHYGLVNGAQYKDGTLLYSAEQLASLQRTINARDTALAMLRKDFEEQLASVQRENSIFKASEKCHKKTSDDLFAMKRERDTMLNFIRTLASGNGITLDNVREFIADMEKS